MDTQTIELSRLKAHPANSNVMPEPLLAKLVDHIERSGRYPPLIVRPIEKHHGDEPILEPGSHPIKVYQVLDGHHRAEALRRLGRQTADCVVWHVDDQEALMLLATLNRLQGQDDPRKRAALVGALSQSHELTALANLLPERREQLKKLLEINARPPALRAPQPIEQMPVAVHFFLLPEYKRRLDAVLRMIGGTREEALMVLMDQHHAGTDAPDTHDEQ